MLIFSNPLFAIIGSIIFRWHLSMQIGSHRELLLRDGLYARLTRKQADAMAWFGFQKQIFYFSSGFILEAVQWGSKYFFSLLLINVFIVPHKKIGKVQQRRKLQKFWFKMHSGFRKISLYQVPRQIQKQT